MTSKAISRQKPFVSEAVLKARAESLRWIFTEHAIGRFNLRVGHTTNPENAMRNRLACRKWLVRDWWYAKGLIFVLNGWIVVTVFKPDSPYAQRKIWQAVQADKDFAI